MGFRTLLLEKRKIDSRHVQNVRTFKMLPNMGLFLEIAAQENIVLSDPALKSSQVITIISCCHSWFLLLKLLVNQDSMCIMSLSCLQNFHVDSSSK